MIMIADSTVSMVASLLTFSWIVAFVAEVADLGLPRPTAAATGAFMLSR